MKLIHSIVLWKRGIVTISLNTYLDHGSIDEVKRFDVYQCLPWACDKVDAWESHPHSQNVLMLLDSPCEWQGALGIALALADPKDLTEVEREYISH